RPGRERALHEVLVGPQAVLEHPVRLVLEAADLLDRRARQAALRLGEVVDVVVERELFALVGDEVARRGHSVSGRGARRARTRVVRQSRVTLSELTAEASTSPKSADAAGVEDAAPAEDPDGDEDAERCEHEDRGRGDRRVEVAFLELAVDDERKRPGPAFDVAGEHDRRPELAER